MTRELRVVPAADASIVLAALRQALTADGPAILPAATGFDPAGLPSTVAQRIALVVETSGSTGRPKRVALSADALLSSAAASASALGGPGQWLLALPAHYVAGTNVLVRSLAAETEPVMLPGGHFDVGRFVQAARSMDADLRFVSLVPAQLRRLLAAERALGVLRRFDRILVGGQSTPLDVLAHALELGLNLTRTYGSSETSGGCVYDGVPIGNTRVRISDGQVELAGSVLAEGYLGDDQRTADRFQLSDGVRWYRTGDTGRWEGGTLRVTGRMDDIIISGGVKVSLADVERVVRAMPGLGEAVVVAVASDRWGQVPVVVSTASVDLTRLRDDVKAVLGPAAAPASVRVVPVLPRLASGKPDRRALVALASADSAAR
ncbi:o-succinylbenzoate--CoA ligase [Parafrigoribacterium mesophilum]|uniref:AMP-binding protein n=1 Tax=Parafrigoribacterium mesophilum TaxID=433646 RepID=UPI0031FC7963